MAFVIATHIVQDANSCLAKILSNHTNMPIIVASAAMAIRANHVYVSAPNTDLLYAYEHPIFPESNIRDCLDDASGCSREPASLGIGGN